MANAGTYDNPITAAPITQLPSFIEERGIDLQQWTAIKNSLYPGSRDESIAAVIDYCKARQLDVFKKPVHIVPMKVKNPVSGYDEWRDVVMPGIYELRITAMRSNAYVGQDPPTHGPIVKYKGVDAPEWSEVTVHRLIARESRAFTHRARFAEECATKSNGEINSMWRRRPYGQLDKVAEAGALRKAFPEDLGGVMSAEEVTSAAIDMGMVDRVADEATATQRTAQRMDAAKEKPQPPESAQEATDADPATDATPDAEQGESFKEVAAALESAADFEQLNEAIDRIRNVASDDDKATLRRVQAAKVSALREGAAA